MLSVKRGDTLSFVVKRKNTDGSPMTGDENKLRSQLRDKSDVLQGEFVITETDTLGEYLFVIPPTVTKNWKEGSLFFDIEYRDGDLVSSSTTSEVKVIKDVTRDD